MRGPAPKHPDQRARQNATLPMVRLPAEGRKGRTPPWPLPVKASTAERTIWAQLWRTPMAVQWERLGWFRDVALFARLQAAAEGGAMALVPEARRRGEHLGLTPLALSRLRWEVSGDEVAPRRAPTVKRQRLVLVEDDADAVAGS